MQVLCSLALILANTTLYTRAIPQDSLSGLYKKTTHERIELVQQKAHLNAQETDRLEHSVTSWANHWASEQIMIGQLQCKVHVNYRQRNY